MANQTNDPLLYFNGINGATGDYGLPSITAEQLSSVVEGEPDESFLKELKWRASRTTYGIHMGVKEGIDPEKLEESGWGVIFASDADPAIKEALGPLLELRRSQAGDLYRCYEKRVGFRVGKDSKGTFLARHGLGPGPVDPLKVPYYLLIVGSPEKIPYRFQTQIDVQFAVGRIDFGDDVDAYANYADSVVAAETGRLALSRQISFFGVANDDDPATGLSSEHLVSPLLDHLEKNQPDWQARALLKDQAHKADLARLLGGPETPALLFTASHGMEFPIDDPRQIPHQGALLCQDWPGPKAWRGRGAIPQDHYFAGDDLPSSANLLGLMGFFFACYGCGTPHLDEFSKQAFKDRRAAIAPHAFLAGLPTRMLSNPGGGALAVIGHVERAWGCSFVWQNAGVQTAVFESTLDRLLDGQTVGSAVEYFNERYAELSTDLTDELEEAEYGKQVDPYEVAGMWTANNDARGYMILGDPATRLPLVATGEEAAPRPQIELRAIGTASLASAAGGPAAEVAVAPPATESGPDAPDTAASAADTAPSFGLFGGSSGKSSESGAFQELIKKVGDFLEQTLEDVTTLKVDTWVSDDLEKARFENGAYTSAELRASTRIMVDGDTQNLVARGKDGEVDDKVWAIHSASVQQAREARAEMVKTVVSVGTKLLG